eukprot:6510030-Prymnesium_polylepis.1
MTHEHSQMIICPRGALGPHPRPATEALEPRVILRFYALPQPNMQPTAPVQSAAKTPTLPCNRPPVAVNRSRGCLLLSSAPLASRSSDP